MQLSHVRRIAARCLSLLHAGHGARERSPSKVAWRTCACHVHSGSSVWQSSTFDRFLECSGQIWTACAVYVFLAVFECTPTAGGRGCEKDLCCNGLMPTALLQQVNYSKKHSLPLPHGCRQSQYMHIAESLWLQVSFDTHRAKTPCPLALLILAHYLTMVRVDHRVCIRQGSL